MEKQIAKNTIKFGSNIANQISDHIKECCLNFAKDCYKSLIDLSGPGLYDAYLEYAEFYNLPEWKKGVLMTYFKEYTGEPKFKRIGTNKNATRVYNIKPEYIEKFSMVDKTA